MKSIRLTIALIVTMSVFSQRSSAQIVDFYSSPGYSNFISTMIDNSIWKSSMEQYTKDYKPGKDDKRSQVPRKSEPEVVPEYRRFPIVQFKSTGTRITLQTYLDAVEATREEKAELKETILKIFKDYESGTAARSYPNDWALAYVSFIGLNSHIYSGNKEKPLLHFEQNVGLRDAVAEHAHYNGIFKDVTDKEKQELYELMIIIAGLTYHFYEKACKENNVTEIETCKLAAVQNLKLIGISVEK